MESSYIPLRLPSRYKEVDRLGEAARSWKKWNLSNSAVLVCCHPQVMGHFIFNSRRQSKFEVIGPVTQTAVVKLSLPTVSKFREYAAVYSKRFRLKGTFSFEKPDLQLHKLHSQTIYIILANPAVSGERKSVLIRLPRRLGHFN